MAELGELKTSKLLQNLQRTQRDLSEITAQMQSRPLSDNAAVSSDLA